MAPSIHQRIWMFYASISAKLLFLLFLRIFYPYTNLFFNHIHCYRCRTIFPLSVFISLTILAHILHPWDCIDVPFVTLHPSPPLGSFLSQLFPVSGALSRYYLLTACRCCLFVTWNVEMSNMAMNAGNEPRRQLPSYRIIYICHCFQSYDKVFLLIIPWTWIIHCKDLFHQCFLLGIEVERRFPHMNNTIIPVEFRDAIQLFFEMQAILNKPNDLSLERRLIKNDIFCSLLIRSNDVVEGPRIC